MWHSVLLFILVSYLSSSCHVTWIQTQSRGYSFLEKLAIAKTAKYFWTTTKINMNWLTHRQFRFCLGLGKNIGSSIIPHNRSSNFPAHFLSKIMQWYLFFLHPTRKTTYLKVDISFKLPKVLSFQIWRSTYFARWKKQVACFNKLRVQKRFRI